MPKNFTKYLTQNIIKIFLIFIVSCNFKINSDCTSCGTPGRCGYCGESQPTCCNSLCVGYPFLLPRNQGRNSAREIVGTQQAENKYGLDIFNGFLSAALEYQRSFDNQQIPRYFFGQDYVSCKNLYIQGSQVQNRNDKAWLADYFGLPSDFSSTLSLCPKIQNVILDLNFYAGLDNLTEGLFVKVAMPIAWTKTELNPCEKICNSGINNYTAGYLSTETIDRQDLTTSFLEFMSGNSTFGDMKEPLKYGLITKDKLTKAGLAELRASLGYNFILKPDYHFGFAFLLSAPTGNKPCAKYLFEPIIGNGKHWEIGCELSGSWILHRCKDNSEKYIGFWIDATLTHLARNCQLRSFDISCKTNSRYMLLEQMVAVNKDNLNIKDTNQDQIYSTYQYAKNLTPAINWSTFKLDVTIDLQADIAVKFGIVRNNFSIDLGYDFWGRMGERFTLNPCCASRCCACPPCYNMAIKGDAFLYGYYENVQLDPAIALGATQSQATIYSGKNYPDAAFGSNPISNPKIDNPNPAGYLTYSGANQLKSKDATVNINTSIKDASSQSILIAPGGINLDDSPSGVTNKFFAHFNYYSKNRETKWLPFIGIGGEVEIASHRCKIPACSNSCYLCDFCCDTSCSKRMGISQWGLWLKGGASFN